MKRRLIALAPLLLPAVGCGLILDFDPPDGGALECFVTVRSADGEEIEVSSLMTPEVAGRDYFVCVSGPCPSGCDRDEVADSMPDFQNWVRLRIDDVAAITDPADPLFGSDFRTRPGPWCQVPGTLRCASRGALTGSVACPPAIPAATLPGCSPGPPPPPGGEPCVSVECRGGPCTEILYGDLPVGDTVGDTVTVSNCGDDELRLQIDEMVFGVPPLDDFEIPAAANFCRPRTLEEERSGRVLTSVAVDPAGSDCSFDVLFRPTDPGTHRGSVRFWSDADPRHEIRLQGVGVGGVLRHSVPDNVCFDRLDGPCTPEQMITVRNGGPGDVTIRDVRIEGSAGFDLVAPAAGTLPITISDPGPPLEIRLRWCDIGIPTASSNLVIDSNDPMQPTIMIRIAWDSRGCPAP